METNNTPKVFCSDCYIRFPDCDPFNHLNNARYLDYFINAREDQVMQNLGINFYQQAAETGRSWVVYQNQIAYLQPALLMERVHIQSTILEFNSSDILVEFRMYDDAHANLKALLWTRFVHYDLKRGRRVAHAADVTGIYKPLENPLPTPTAFEERVQALRQRGYSLVE
jgi:acyl-CoA thioester hydrolase